MSELHHTLNDQTQRLESTLSFLFNAGDAGDSFQRDIFQYLNIQDARNLRIANRRLDRIVRGVPLWAAQDSKGNPVITRIPPAAASASSANPNPVQRPVGNSTLRWLGATCNGERFDQNPPRPCRNGPLQDIEMKRCEGIPPPWNRTHPLGLRCRGDVCIHCVNSAANKTQTIEHATIEGARTVPLCWRCQLYEARRHPDGYMGCTCEESLSRNRWLCYACRHGTRFQMGNKAVDDEALIINLHRDRQGRKIRDLKIRTRARRPCPGCARYFLDGNHRPDHVSCCMACNGVIVEPTLGVNFQPTKLMTRPPQRRSSRIANRYAAMPSLDLEPDIVR